MEEIYANIDVVRTLSSKSSTIQEGPRRFFRASVLGLGLLSVFLLAGLIVLAVHYHDVTEERDRLKASLTEKTSEVLRLQCLMDKRPIPTPPPPNPPVRLVGSTNSCSGRVEIFHNGAWGTVCDDNWDLNDAHVVCGQLDCGRAVEAKQGSHFGQGTGSILLDDLQCSGNEISL
ncbi:scavenger receptor cysteine-rich domain-containing group B protein-like [Trematomus bernacchii]|uniref:scavenger receptor cysteine-rich domain-containing group B protein-like n=1 Tax=Trematomus bernacchii TaxID=40690 RepID=UPI00146CF18A|nr:scavenger receptor cysteine-rich domain-containing group B protein-like [Trematomus bernacchii]